MGEDRRAADEIVEVLERRRRLLRAMSGGQAVGVMLANDGA